MRINKHDTNGTKPLLGKGELGYDDYAAGGDVGRVYVGTGDENIALAEKSEIDSHVNRVDNPHSVTKAQVGLGNVDNTADVNKNVATAVKAFTLGEVRQFPTDNNQDFNSCTDGGVYSVLWGNFTGTLNAPPTGLQYGTLLVEAGTLFMTQTFTAAHETITYKRTKYIESSWSAWTRVISEDANGNVGIGTKSPIAKLHVHGKVGFSGGSGTSINSDSGLGIDAINGGNTSIYNYLDTSSIDLWAGASQKTGIHINGQSATGGSYLGFSAGGVERMRVTSSGNVGIGTKSPSNFEGYNTLTITGKDTSHGGVIELNNSDGSNKVQMVNTGDIFNIGTVSNHPVKIRTGATSRLSIEANGRTTVGTPIVSESTGAQLRVEAQAANDTSAASILISRHSDNYSSAMWHNYDSSYGNESFNLSVSPAGGASSLNGNYRKYSVLGNGMHKWFGGTTLSNPMTLASSGNLLVGTQADNGLSKLQVGGSISVGDSMSNWTNFNVVSLRSDNSAIVGGIASAGGGSNSNFLFNNCYYNGGWKHSYAGNYPATLHEYGGGNFVWYSAASDTGGNPADFSVDMILTGGKLGIGTSSPSSSLTIKEGITLISQLNNSTARPALMPGVQKYGVHVGTGAEDHGFLRLSAGGGTNTYGKSYIDVSGYSAVPDMNMNIVFGTSGSERMRIDANGNIGIGVTPSAWGSSTKSIQLNPYGGAVGASTYEAANVFLVSNAYQSNINAWNYTLSGSLAAKYELIGGQHTWKTAPNGTAGSPITWTNAMTLSSSGNLLVGTATDNGVDKLQVNGSISSGTINVYTAGDLNDFKHRTQVIGTYPSMTNCPLVDHGYLEIIVYSTNNWVMQRWTCLGAVTGSDGGRVFVRVFKSATAWSPWVENASINTSGNMLIGTTTDNGVDKLQVNGGIKATRYISYNKVLSNGGIVIHHNAQSKYIQIKTNCVASNAAHIILSGFCYTSAYLMHLDCVGYADGNFTITRNIIKDINGNGVTGSWYKSSDDKLCLELVATTDTGFSGSLLNMDLQRTLYSPPILEILSYSVSGTQSRY